MVIFTEKTIFNEDTFKVYNSSDPTKFLSFNLDSISSSTTRTLSMPDRDGTIALIDDLAEIPLHNDLQGLNDGDYKHLTAIEKSNVDGLIDSHLGNDYAPLSLLSTFNNHHHDTEYDALGSASGAVGTHEDNYDHGIYNIHLTDDTNPHSVDKSDVGLNNVENTALSTWPGTTNITTLGTITTGVWNGTALGAGYVPNHDNLNNVNANEHIDWTSATSQSLVCNTLSLNSGDIFLGDNQKIDWGTAAIYADDSNNLVLDPQDGGGSGVVNIESDVNMPSSVLTANNVTTNVFGSVGTTQTFFVNSKQFMYLASTFSDSITINPNADNIDFYIEDQTGGNLFAVDVSEETIDIDGTLNVSGGNNVIGSSGLGLGTPLTLLGGPSSSLSQLRLGLYNENVGANISVITSLPVDQTEEDTCILYLINQGGYARFGWGGGSVGLNAASYHSFYTAPNNTAISGDLRFEIDPNGDFDFQTGLATFGNDIYISANDKGIYFGDNQDTSMVYNSTEDSIKFDGTVKVEVDDSVMGSISNRTLGFSNTTTGINSGTTVISALYGSINTSISHNTGILHLAGLDFAIYNNGDIGNSVFTNVVHTAINATSQFGYSGKTVSTLGSGSYNAGVMSTTSLYGTINTNLPSYGLWLKNTLSIEDGTGNISNYGIYIENFNNITDIGSGGSVESYAIYTNAGKVRFGDDVTISNGSLLAGNSDSSVYWKMDTYAHPTFGGLEIPLLRATSPLIPNIGFIENGLYLWGAADSAIRSLTFSSYDFSSNWQIQYQPSSSSNLIMSAPSSGHFIIPALTEVSNDLYISADDKGIYFGEGQNISMTYDSSNDELNIDGDLHFTASDMTLKYVQNLRLKATGVASILNIENTGFSNTMSLALSGTEAKWLTPEDLVFEVTNEDILFETKASAKIIKFLTNSGNITFYTAAGPPSLVIPTTADGIQVIDNMNAYFGTDKDASIYYDGSNFYIDPKLVGSSDCNILGSVNVETGEAYKVNNTQVVTARQVAADFANTVNTGDTDTDDLINALITALETHGLIASSLEI